jgi:NADH-ubiquinone oxidoreductase B12 subunit family
MGTQVSFTLYTSSSVLKLTSVPKHSEAWRYKGTFSRYNRLIKGTAPGLGIATVAFATYCIYEALFLKDSHHGEEHH